MPLETDRIHKAITHIDKFLKKAPKRPSPERIHQVRTSSRRLESALSTLNISSGKKQLLNDLPKIRKLCGKVRDMDVLIGLAMSVKTQDEDRACLVQLVEHLGTARSKRAKKLRRLAKNNAPRVRKHLARVSKVIDELAAPRSDDSSSVDSQNAAALVELASQLRSPEKLNKRNLHAYRLKIKELRYVLQLAETQQDNKMIATLGQVKDAIGEWHDWEELVAIASEVLDDRPRAGLVQHLKKISDAKFQHALAVANKMRAIYIVYRGRHKKSKPRNTTHKGRTIPFPVSVVRSAMQA
jgi:CHAD domain-containing protein